MRPGTMPKQKYLQHLAFAFVAGGLLTYLCVTLLGRTGTLDAKGDELSQGFAWVHAAALMLAQH